ncbi:DUF4280 domain-containing protein [Paenibacillus glacialis]|uniref:DUF4280 domain-containing protein n=1 Tax=Paenibacillus glacialis TaxID=494026 RepID=A0A168N7Z4_9BACL|nr:DUF4280 domain-containing protein [Paenibacillus glacialis]OAB45501.1 hypothetical protein PGLA_04415 [Paenibacillus glacialis]
MSDQPAYVVRGATMYCHFGTHRRRINLPESHGTYVNEKPMMNVDDCKPDNIPYFGICISPNNTSSEVIYLIAEDGTTISGKPCLPVPFGNWRNGKEGTLVEGKAALTTQSTLVCSLSCEKEIAFLKDGQHDE